MYICKICNTEYEYKVGLTKHLNRKHDVDTYQYWKDNYPDEIPSRLMRSHLKSLQSEKYIRTKNKVSYSNLDGETFVICPICNRKFKTLNTHLYTHGITSEQFHKEYPTCSMLSVKVHNKSSKVMKSILADEWSNPDYVKRQSERLKERYHNPNDPLIINKTKHSGRKRYPFRLSDGRIMNARSTWELQVARELDSNNIKFLYESFTIDYSINGKSHVYYPDFYLPDSNTIIEVKGDHLLHNLDVKLKKKASLDLGYNYLIVSSQNLYTFLNQLNYNK